MAFKSLDEKSCEIKGGGHEMAAMMLMIIMHKTINIIAAISWPPFFFDFTTFFTKHFEGCTLSYSLVVIAWISLLSLFYLKLNLNQNSPTEKKVRPQKGQDEKRCEIQGGGQEMAVMVG